jgi:hypothetical protein
MFMVGVRMTRTEIRDQIEELRMDIAYLGKEEVDDPEQVMNNFGLNSAKLVEALDYCLKMLHDDKPGPDN